MNVLLLLSNQGRLGESLDPFSLNETPAPFVRGQQPARPESSLRAFGPGCSVLVVVRGIPRARNPKTTAVIQNALAA